MLWDSSQKNVKNEKNKKKIKIKNKNEKINAQKGTLKHDHFQ
jgi:hypothetical protein